MELKPDELVEAPGYAPREPRIYTRCPACRNDTLTLNNGHLLCTWMTCPDPTLIDRAGEGHTVGTERTDTAGGASEAK
jgi:hypothetical protein